MMLCGDGGLLHCLFAGLGKKEQGNKSMVRVVVVRRAEVSARDTRTVTPEPKDDDHPPWEIKYT